MDRSIAVVVACVGYELCAVIAVECVRVSVRHGENIVRKAA